MDYEPFTFVTLTSSGHNVETLYLLRADADKRFDHLASIAGTIAVAYYCASVGGLVNCQTNGL